MRAAAAQTDTASVLHETIEYIKFLHEQVGVSAIDPAAVHAALVL